MTIRDEIEEMVDQTSLMQVLDELVTMCNSKIAHIETEQAPKSARAWIDAGTAIYAVVTKVERLGI